MEAETLFLRDRVITKMISGLTEILSLPQKQAGLRAVDNAVEPSWSSPRLSVLAAVTVIPN